MKTINGKIVVLGIWLLLGLAEGVPIALASTDTLDNGLNVQTSETVEDESLEDESLEGESTTLDDEENVFGGDDAGLDDEARVFGNDEAELDDEDYTFDDEDNVFGESEELETAEQRDDWDELASLPINGFVEVERGARLGVSENHDNTFLLANFRVRLKTSGNTDKGGFDVKLDFITDEITHETVTDVREARLRYSPTEWMDLSVGRQVATWGVGDLVFINDLFPKNWINFFAGRDVESLKDPSNILRATVYLGDWTWDTVWTPQFDPSTTPTGCRFSVFNPNHANPSNSNSLGQKTVANPESCQHFPDSVAEQNNQAENGEIAMRLSVLWGTQEVAFYGYNGFWKSPKGVRFNLETGLLEPIHPRLGVYGLSSEGQWGPGIFFLEAGHYLSHEDRDGTDPLIENSMVRMLLGYRYDVSATQTVGTQILSEKMLNYDNYQNNLMPGQIEQTEVRNTYTIRFTQTAQQETLRASMFVYHRPENHDGYLRYWVNKRLDDHFDFTVGGNVFSGDRNYLDSEFGMLREDDNLYGRLKYVF